MPKIVVVLLVVIAIRYQNVNDKNSGKCVFRWKET